MKCDRVRVLLSGFSESAGLDRHLAGCEECSRFAVRLQELRRALAARPANVIPDAGFASRVVARLPERDPVLGWAALRFMPAAAAMLLVLGIWAWVGTAPPSHLTTASPTDDLIAWVLLPGDSGND